MAEITASMVKQLRELTGAGMMDAKNALVENNGSMDAAVDWLRKKGLAKAAKKSSRTAADGLVAITTANNSGAVIEVNSETDFVARNSEFQAFVTEVAKAAIGTNSLEDLNSKKLPNSKTVQENLTDLIAKIGENMSVRRSQSLTVSKGAVIGYVHGELAPGLGKIGVLVALESEAPSEKLQSLGKQIAMHVAAANPECLDQNSIDPAKAQREKDIFSEQARSSGKPEEIIAKMVEGRMRKYYEEVCLIDQIFVIDGETKVSQVVEKAAKDAGAQIKITGYARFQLGDGVARSEEDLAA